MWIFNYPHSSHMGGAWECMIGVTQRILDSMMMTTSLARLSHEVLTTFMAEVLAIVNARALIPVSTDPESPSILTPAMLLTQKIGDIPSIQKTCINANGDRCSASLAPFGTVGGANILSHFRNVANGKLPNRTFKK